VSADSGQELASLTASANGAKDLIPTIGGLTHRLRGKMGESLKALRDYAVLAAERAGLAKNRVEALKMAVDEYLAAAASLTKV